MPECSRPSCTRRAMHTTDALCQVHRRASGMRWHDAAPVRRRIVELQSGGVPRRRIAEASGVGLRTINSITSGQKLVTSGTYRRLVGVDLHVVPTFVPVLPTTRRARALAAAGHSRRDTARAAGIPLRVLSQMRHPVRHVMVRRETADAVRQVWDEHAFRPVGRPDPRIPDDWRVPADWDDGEIDTLPDGWWRLVAAPGGSAANRLAVEFQQHESWPHAAARAGISERQARRLRRGEPIVDPARARIKEAAA